MSVPYLTFADLVARAKREVLREPEFQGLITSVIAYSVDATTVDSSTGLTFIPAWGEFYMPDGPIILYQAAFEGMPDQENYYRQIKAVIRHELRHAQGNFGHDDDPQDLIYARVRHV